MMSAEERVRILGEAEPNSWLALSSDESKVVGRGATYSDAVADAEKNGEEDPVLILIPDSWEAKVYLLGSTV
jgi:D-serine dehydratase